MCKKNNYREIAKATNPDQCFCCKRWFTNIVIHHMDGNHENNDETNLIKVCSSCHHMIHWGRRKKGINEERLRHIGSLRKYLYKKKKMRIPFKEDDYSIKAIRTIIL